jgi:hypothetical protein
MPLSCGSADGRFVPEKRSDFTFKIDVSFADYPEGINAELRILKVVSRTFVLSVIVMNNTDYHLLR